MLTRLAPIVAVASASAAALADAANYYLVPDNARLSVMLLDGRDGRLLTQRYVDLAVAHGPLDAVEAAQVGDQIWVTNALASTVVRFSADGLTQFSSLADQNGAALPNPSGFATLDGSVFVSCYDIIEHGVVDPFVSELSLAGDSQGAQDLLGTLHRASDIVADDGALLIANSDNPAIDRVTPTGEFIERLDIAPQPRQIVRLSTGEIAVATNQLGVRVYDASGAEVETHLAGVDCRGVAELGTGELLATGDTGVVAIDRATGAARLLVDTTTAAYASPVSDPALCPADVTADDVVGSADLAHLLATWGDAGVGDVTGDGVTNAADLAILLAAWGQCR